MPKRLCARILPSREVNLLNTIRGIPPRMLDVNYASGHGLRYLGCGLQSISTAELYWMGIDGRRVRRACCFGCQQQQSSFHRSTYHRWDGDRNGMEHDDVSYSGILALYKQRSDLVILYFCAEPVTSESLPSLQ